MEIKILNNKILLKAETGEEYNLLVDILLAGGLRVIRGENTEVLLEPGIPYRVPSKDFVDKMIKKFKAKKVHVFHLRF